MARASKSKTDTRIQAAFSKMCDGVQFSIMDLPKIKAAAQAAIDRGGDDAAIEAAIAEIRDRLRQN